MKYKDENGQWQDIILEPSGDTLPIGSIVDYDGEEVPYGYEKVEEIKPNDYTTEEQVIGTWMDKPLYRKIFTGITPAATQANLATIYNIETLVDIKGCSGRIYKGGITWVNLGMSPQEWRQFYVSGSVLGLVQSQEEEVPYTIILEYTKTTD